MKQKSTNKLLERKVLQALLLKLLTFFKHFQYVKKLLFSYEHIFCNCMQYIAAKHNKITDAKHSKITTLFMLQNTQYISWE